MTDEFYRQPRSLKAFIVHELAKTDWYFGLALELRKAVWQTLQHIYMCIGELPSLDKAPEITPRAQREKELEACKEKYIVLTPQKRADH